MCSLGRLAGLPSLLASLLCARALAAEPGARGAPPSKPVNIVLVVIDSLRLDDAPPLMAGVDAVACEGRAHAAWTRPSVATLFTGALPTVHGVTGPGRALPTTRVTLAEALSARGYQTGAVVTNGILDPSLGFGRGFDRYLVLDGTDTGPRFAPSPLLHAAALAWVAEAGGPFFLYAHSSDPHFPYVPAEQGVGSWAWMEALRLGEVPDAARHAETLRAQYQAEIEENGASLRGFLSDLASIAPGPTLVLVTSDHGEEFHDHGGWTHGKTLHPEITDVPVWLLGWGGTTPTCEGLVRHVDIPRHLARAAGLGPVFGPAPLPPGRTIAHNAVAPGRGAQLLLEEDGRRAYWDGAAWSGAVRTGVGWRDADVDAALGAQGRALLTELAADHPAPSLSAAERERLEALGYLELAPAPPAPPDADRSDGPAVRDGIPAR